MKMKIRETVTSFQPFEHGALPKAGSTGLQLIRAARPGVLITNLRPGLSFTNSSPAKVNMVKHDRENPGEWK